jgi:hypothetical protein
MGAVLPFGNKRGHHSRDKSACASTSFLSRAPLSPALSLALPPFPKTNLTPLAAGAAGNRHFVLFWEIFPILR